MPSLSTSSSSSSSATKRVDKATSELLVGPDWTMNMEICDICNSNHWMAKDVVKEVKRRLQHKNPKVQLLALTLLETMVKNCGEYIHYNIAERKIVDEMVKIVKKKTDIHVRNKILALLDSWQEAFGGASGKYTQYFWACDELRRYGIQFPQRSQHSAPVITPPVTHHTGAAQVGFGMPTNSSTRLDEAMNSEVEGLSFSILESMRSVLELLNDMLQAVNPSDRMAVKDEVIVDLVDRCRANQKKLLQMITTTTDEELLVKGIEMNDAMQLVLGKYDAIASGAPLSNNGVQPSELANSSVKTNDARDKSPATDAESSGSSAPVPKDQAEEEEEEDEFAQLARRHSKAHSTPSQSTASGATEDVASSNSNALVVIDVPAPEPATTNTTTKEQELIDLLSIVLTSSSTSDETPQAPISAPMETISQVSRNSYVVPWAQPQPQPQSQLQTPFRPMQTPMQSQFQQQGHSQYSSNYPPPPWEATSGYINNQYPGINPYTNPPSQGNINSSIPSQNFNSFQNTQYGNQFYSTAQPPVSSSLSPMQGTQSLNGNFYPTPPSKPTNGNVPVTNGSGSIPSGQKPFVPSYRLFEDLNVFGGSEGKLKSGPYASSSGNPSQNMIAGRR